MIDLKKIYEEASSLLPADQEKALALLTPLLEAQKTDENAVYVLFRILKENDLPHETGLEFLSDIYDAHRDNEGIVLEIGTLLEKAMDLGDLNAPPPDHPFFNDVIQNLLEISGASHGQNKEAEVAEALSGSARLLGRQFDEVAERNYTRLVELLPNTHWTHYNLGLFYKTRGRFEEGVRANQKAIELSDEENEAHIWNLGICATGAGRGDIALDIWKGIGNTIEMGRFGLPEGGYPSCKVKLAEHPLAERDADNDHPGREETIWIERLSPCHGIIRSVLYQDLGVDYGDVILFDGAPITYHKYGDEQIAVFPHLSTLVRSNYHFYPFAATQNETGEINTLDRAFDDDIVIYSHTENYRVLCSACWRNEDLDHAQHTETEEKHIVTGRIAAPPEINPSTLLALIDEALKAHPLCKIYSPELCEAADQHDRAFIEAKRYEMLKST